MDTAGLPALQPGQVAISRERLADMLAEGEARVRSMMSAAKAAALDAQAAAHAGELARLREALTAEHRAEKVEAQKAAHAHGFHKAAWIFGGSGLAAGIAVTLLVVAAVTAYSSEATVRGAGVGSAITRQEQNRDDLDRLHSPTLQDREAERQRGQQ